MPYADTIQRNTHLAAVQRLSTIKAESVNQGYQ